MTEDEWRLTNDPEPMLDFLWLKASQRGLRLVAVAYCLQIWHLITDERSRQAVEMAEQFADQLVAEDILDAASSAARQAYRELISRDLQHASIFADTARRASINPLDVGHIRIILKRPAEATTMHITRDNNLRRHFYFDRESYSRQRTYQANLLREIFGPHPLRPVTLDPSWVTPTVVSLAQGIYADRVFDRMPILADALKNAGCDDEEILNHCRSDGPHVRGCWVVDLLLGRE